MKRTRPPLPLLLLMPILSGCGFLDAFSDPRSDKAITVLDVTPGGRYVGAINGRGAVAIWRLETKEKLRIPQFEMPGGSSPLLLPLNGFGFRGDTGEVLYECASHKVCTLDLATGEERELFDHGDSQDRIHLIASSANGSRMAFGTLAGRVLTFDAEDGELQERKPRDRWTPGDPYPIYLLEGTDDLRLFLSATTQAGGANESVVEGLGTPHFAEGYLEFERRREPLWLGPVIWRFEGGDPNPGIAGVGTVVRADFGPRQNRIAICEEGGPRLVLDYPSLRKRVDLSLLGHKFTSDCGGIRFLDEAGDWIGIIAKGMNEMELCHRDAEGSWSCRDRFRLRRKPGSGARPLIALPERRWFFVGLAEGGVDWYELDTEGEGRARVLAHLSWDD